MAVLASEEELLGLDAHRIPSPAEWLRLPVDRLAAWVEGRGRPVVMGWPFNGTRRWYLSYRSRHPDAPGDYLSVTGRRQAELHGMVFAHGVRYLLVPLFGTQLLDRGPDYVRYALGGLTVLRDDEVYRRLYAGGVRVRFYGDYRGRLGGLGLGSVVDACDELTAATSSGTGPVLMFGLFADDPYATLARMSVAFASEHGRPPDRAELIEAYYGIPVPDLGIYLGFDQHSLFDVPLLTTGMEDLYATLNPSPTVTERQLREILYDHIVTRRAPEVDYEDLSPEGAEALVRSTERWDAQTLGLGEVDALTQTWFPAIPKPPEVGEPRA